MSYEQIYEKNRIALNKYKWQRHGEWPEYENLAVKAEQAGKNEYVYKMGEYVSRHIRIERTNINTKPFFRDLTKPLLLKNEFNSYNIEYVVDNVRKSEDFGGDNHVYLYYDRIEEFALLLQVLDFTPYLVENKIVFIFGEEDLKENYPLNFKDVYGIDYENMPSQPVGIKEIKRIFLTWSLYASSGVRTFFYPLLDEHPNMIYFNWYFFPFDQFAAIYRCFLQGKTTLQFAEMFFTEFENEPNWGGTWKDRIRSLFYSDEAKNMKDIDEALDNKFWQTLLYLFPLDYVPNDLEWLKAFAIAKAQNSGQNLNSRVTPALVMFFNETTRKKSMIENNVLPILKKFKYIRIISIIRRLTINAGSNVDDHALNQWNLLAAIAVFIKKYPSPQVHPYHNGFFISAKDDFLPCRKVMRFEDLKLEPLASMEALCDFFDIPFSDTLIQGKGEFKNPNDNKVTKGFQKTAVFNLHETRFSHYDYYRLELVMGKAYEYYGYKPIYYTDGKKYTNEEIVEMYKEPFKVEEFNVTKEQLENNKATREWLYFYLRQQLTIPFDRDENGEKLVYIPWLKPKKEFMQGKLYE